METLQNCPLCGLENSQIPFSTCHDHMVSQKAFDIVQCSGCSLVFTNPRPEASEMDSFYQSEDYISHTESKRSLKEKIYHWVRNEMLRRKGKLIHNLRPGKKRILDVGCSAGTFLKYIQSDDNEVVGFEPADFPRLKAIEKGLRVMGLEHELEKEGNFDIITLWHVLEHMPDFKKKLGLFNQLLVPGGLLILAVPLWKSFDAGFYKEHWAAYDVPRHLFHFEESTLVAACQTSGFTFVQKNALPFDAYYVALLSEQYLKNSFFGWVRAILVGTLSGILAMTGRKPWSSQVFVLQKHGSLK